MSLAQNTIPSLVGTLALTLAVMLLVPYLRQWWCVPPLYLLITITTMGFWQKRMSNKLRHFVTPKEIPILGHLHIIIGSREKMFRNLRDLRQEFGSRFVLRNLNEYSVNISDADAIETLLTCTKNLKKGPEYDFLTPWLGNGLLTAFGQHWSEHRKLLTPAFHFSILDKLAPRIQHHAEIFADTLENMMRKDENGTVELMKHITRSTLGAILEAAMGVDSDEIDDDYVKAVHTFASLSTRRASRFWLWSESMYGLFAEGRESRKAIDLLHSFSKKVIAKRKTFLASRPVDSADSDDNDVGIRKKLAFLDVLLIAQRNGANLTDEDIRDEVDTFTFEGHDTTAVSIYWTLHVLGDHPEIQERLREEVCSVELKDVLKLPYLDLVIRESLRLYPSVPFISRQLTQPLKFNEEQIVYPTMAVDVHFFDLHRDEKSFPNPTKFDPEREYPTHPFAYVPFSGGSRNCIGRKLASMELKFFIAAALQRLRFKKPPVPHDQVPIPIDLVLRPGIELRMPVEPLIS